MNAHSLDVFTSRAWQTWVACPHETRVYATVKSSKPNKRFNFFFNKLFKTTIYYCSTASLTIWLINLFSNSEHDYTRSWAFHFRSCARCLRHPIVNHSSILHHGDGNRCVRKRGKYANITVKVVRRHLFPRLKRKRSWK